MSLAHRVTICVLINESASNHFAQCLDRIIERTPLDQVRLRFGFNATAPSFHYALGALCPDQHMPDCVALPQTMERFRWTGRDGLPIEAWLATQRLQEDRLRRVMFHDVTFETEHVIAMEANVFVEHDWWDALMPALQMGIDYIGQPKWHTYSPAQMEAIQSFPWYMGVPFDHKNGRAGVSFMEPSFFVLRAEAIRQANYPDTSIARTVDAACVCDSHVLLGEIARQLAWSQALHAVHAEHAKIGTHS